MTTRALFRTLTLAATIGLFLMGSSPPAAAQSPSKWLPSIGFTVNTALGRPSTNWGPGATATLLRRSGRLGFGLELGYQAFGTEVSQVADFNNQPGSVLREEFKRSMLRLAALVRVDAGSGRVRPYLIGGAGAYDGRFHDRIEVFDPAGQPIHLYDFEGSGGDVKPGLTAGVGLDLRRATGKLGLALEARWHGVLDVTEDGFGTADFLSLGLALTW